MWAALVNFFLGPGIAALISLYKAKLAAENTSEKTAADLASTEIAAQTTEATLQAQLKTAEIGHPYEPEKLAMYIVLVHLGKCVVWDTVLGFGSTPMLKGDIASWEGMIMAYYFGKRTFENVARIIKR